MAKVAIVQIKADVLLEMLDFKGGKLHRVFFDNEEWEPETLNLIIEHPDLTYDVPPGGKIPKVQPIYIRGTDNYEITRVDPPKKKAKV